jgi:hypothetical protein
VSILTQPAMRHANLLQTVIHATKSLDSLTFS